MTQQLAIVHHLEPFIPQAFSTYVPPKERAEFQTLLRLNWEARNSTEHKRIDASRIEREVDANGCRAAIIRALTVNDYKLIDLSHKIGFRMSKVANECAHLAAQGVIIQKRDGNTRKFHLVCAKDNRGATMNEAEAMIWNLMKDRRSRTVDDITVRMPAHIKPRVKKALWQLREHGFLAANKIRDVTIYDAINP